jgi:transcriptional regulator with XRE-family HTH domain
MSSQLTDAEVKHVRRTLTEYREQMQNVARMSRQMGMSEVMVGGVLSGRLRPGFGVAHGLAKALEVTIESLLAGTAEVVVPEDGGAR